MGIGAYYAAGLPCCVSAALGPSEVGASVCASGLAVKAATATAIAAAEAATAITTTETTAIATAEATAVATWAFHHQIHAGASWVRLTTRVATR